MGIISNATPKKASPTTQNKSFKETKKWISEEFYQALNRHMVNDDGISVTYAQQMVASVVDMATNPEKDDYLRLAATKFITEHLEGKASTMTDDRHEEMPKLVICVQGTSPSDMAETVKELEGAEPKEDILIEISDEDGSNSEACLV